MKILFFSPMPKKPTGGVRVIYSYVAKLREIGFDAYVYHPVNGYYYKYTKDKVPIYSGKKISKYDHIVIPDVYISRLNKKTLPNGINFSLLIQNPYIFRSIGRYSNIENITYAFQHASKILCISEDAIDMVNKMLPLNKHKLMRVSWSLESKMFLNSEKKKKIISYMPRKNITHINLLHECLYSNLPNDWQMKSIEGVSQKELIKILQQSSIFLQFGSFEGLPAPPVEAAISGNYVIGYHGNGGKEYWSEPNFTEINAGNISKFTEEILSKINKINNNKNSFLELEKGIDALVHKFSYTQELAYLKDFIDKIIENKEESNVIDLKKTYKLPFKENYLNFHFNRLITKFIQLKDGY